VAGRRAAQDEVRASVVAKKRGNSRGAKGTQEGGKMRNRNTEDEPARVPARASQWWNQPSAIDLVGTERLTASLGTALCALPLQWRSTNWKAGCGRPACPVWREGERTTALPTPIRGARAVGPRPAGRGPACRQVGQAVKAVTSHRTPKHLRFPSEWVATRGFENPRSWHSGFRRFDRYAEEQARAAWL
jgi:hypothetical protein